MGTSCYMVLLLLLLLGAGCSPQNTGASDVETNHSAAPSAGKNTADATIRAAAAGSTTNPTKDDGAPSEQKLVGTWEADDVDAKIGEVRIRLTFREEGGMKLAAWSDIPFAGQVRDKKGSYEVHDNVISSEAIRGGTSVEFWFDGDDLMIKYKEGKTVRFHRV